MTGTSVDHRSYRLGQAAALDAIASRLRELLTEITRERAALELPRRHPGGGEQP